MIGGEAVQVSVQVVHVSSRQSFRDRRSFETRPVMVLLLCAGLLSFFVYQAFQHRYGLETRAGLQERSVALGRDLDRLEAVRASLERDTRLLGADPPDRDLLDEHARRVLGFLRAGDRRIQD